MAWQIIKRLLGNAMPWLLAGLLGFAAYAYAQANRYEAERDTAIQQADMFAASLAWQKQQTIALSNALARRDDQLQQIADGLDAQQLSLDILERDDEPTRDWSAEPVPNAIADWVRQLPASDNPDS